MTLTKAEKTHLGNMLDDELFGKFLDSMYEDGKEEMVSAILTADPGDLIMKKMNCLLIKKIKDTMKNYLSRAHEPVPENS